MPYLATTTAPRLTPAIHPSRSPFGGPPGSSRSWPPAPLGNTDRLDPRRWQSRAARGLSWHAEGQARRGTHEV